MPNELIANPEHMQGSGPSQDVLSDVLRSIRFSGSVQFCFMPSGDWKTDPKASLRSIGAAGNIIPFHIVVHGECWIRMKDREFSAGEGDVLVFPFGAPHDLGSGNGSTLINPISDLPARPWRELPVVRYGETATPTRILCGYLNCDALDFRPMRAALPDVIHVRTKSSNEAAWLRAALKQIVLESDQPRPGGLSMLERLTEIVFIEILRHQILMTPPEAAGWLAALTDPALARCLALLHDAPERNWTVNRLSAAAGLSRSTLMERFETKLNTSPMRYLRDWRLCLASIALATTVKPIASIAEQAGYGTEAAFNRAFSRAYGLPPAAFRRQARKAANAAV
jgi:AraC-like DNA-binding protein